MQLLTYVLILIFPVVAMAEETTVQTIPAGDDQIEVLIQGKPAPFTGQLFSQDTALRWANWLTQYKLRLVQDVEYEKKICAAELNFKETVTFAEAERNKTINDDLRARILRLEGYNAKLNEKINNPSFFRSTEFGLILGVVGSSAVAVAIAIATK